MSNKRYRKDRNLRLVERRRTESGLRVDQWRRTSFAIQLELHCRKWLIEWRAASSGQTRWSHRTDVSGSCDAKERLVDLFLHACHQVNASNITSTINNATTKPTFGEIVDRMKIDGKFAWRASRAQSEYAEESMHRFGFHPPLQPPLVQSPCTRHGTFAPGNRWFDELVSDYHWWWSSFVIASGESWFKKEECVERTCDMGSDCCKCADGNKSAINGSFRNRSGYR